MLSMSSAGSFDSNRNIKVKSLKSKTFKESLQFPIINSLPLAIFCDFAERFLSDLDRNPGERLFHVEAQIREQH